MWNLSPCLLAPINVCQSAQALKHRLNRHAIVRIAEHLQQSQTDFPSQAFIQTACADLEAASLKHRVALIAHAIAMYLPQDDRLAVQTIWRCGNQWPFLGQAGWQDYAAWPLMEAVSLRFPHLPITAALLLAHLTRLFTAEFAMRPLLQKHLASLLPILRRWTQHPCQHVRRLSSEALRPRLPWAAHLSELKQQPDLILSVLEQLRDDPAQYVQKSVANCLKDISKDHPDCVDVLTKRWAINATAQRLAVIRRARRFLDAAN